MAWLFGILAYAAALGVVLMLVSGVKRADARHQRAARSTHRPVRDPGPPPRVSEEPATRVARVMVGRH